MLFINVSNKAKRNVTELIMDTIVERFEAEVIDGDFGVCTLGSCQYSTVSNALSFFLSA